MKSIKYLLVFVLFAAITFTATSCSGCDGEDARARIINNGTDKASVQIKTSGGNTVNINNVESGTSSNYDSYAPGLITFTITVKNVVSEEIVNLSTCTDYDIAIDANNNITSTAMVRE